MDMVSWLTAQKGNFWTVHVQNWIATFLLSRMPNLDKFLPNLYNVLTYKRKNSNVSIRKTMTALFYNQKGVNIKGGGNKTNTLNLKNRP